MLNRAMINACNLHDKVFNSSLGSYEDILWPKDLNFLVKSIMENYTK
jgi:hypothetical protein